MGELVGSGSSVKVRFWIWFEGMADRFAVGVKDREEERIGPRCFSKYMELQSCF